MINKDKLKKNQIDEYLFDRKKILNKNKIHASRDNNGKLRWGLVDFNSLEELVMVLEFGAKKYDENNWKKGLLTIDICESMLRHIFAYLSGENRDKESGISHIGHILCNAMFLNYMSKNKPEFDNRKK